MPGREELRGELALRNRRQTQIVFPFGHALGKPALGTDLRTVADRQMAGKSRLRPDQAARPDARAARDPGGKCRVRRGLY